MDDELAAFYAELGDVVKSDSNNDKKSVFSITDMVKNISSMEETKPGMLCIRSGGLVENGKCYVHSRIHGSFLFRIQWLKL